MLRFAGIGVDEGKSLPSYEFYSEISFKVLLRKLKLAKLAELGMG